MGTLDQILNLTTIKLNLSQSVHIVIRDCRLIAASAADEVLPNLLPSFKR